MASKEYLERLAAQRDAAAQRAESIATGFVREWRSCSKEDREMIFASLRQANREAELLDKQIAWHNRRTAWTWPAEPAWTD